MDLRAQFFPWAPFRKLLDRFADKSSSQPETRTILFQLVESDVIVADALLDLADFRGCDQHLSNATQLAEDLHGPEKMIIHQRLADLIKKRADLVCDSPRNRRW
jgi:hypothetical protein